MSATRIIAYEILVFQSFALAALVACSPVTRASDAGPGDDVDAATRCPSDLAECGLECVDTNANPLHCGGCDRPCGAGTVCSGGACVSSCEVGTIECSGGCIDPAASRLFCGAAGDCIGQNAGVACDDDRSCSAGVCTCDASMVDCAGVCADLNADPGNCGACGNVCGSEVCEQGECLKRVFVTSRLFRGNFGGLDAADSGCMAEAAQAFVGDASVFQAWLSDGNSGPSLRFATLSNAPYINMQGDIVAENWQGLTSGPLLSPIAYDQFGQPAPLVYFKPSVCDGLPLFWSNTSADGGPYASDLSEFCYDWQSVGGTASLGQADVVMGWSDWCTSYFSCDESAALLCVEQ